TQSLTQLLLHIPPLLGIGRDRARRSHWIDARRYHSPATVSIARRGGRAAAAQGAEGEESEAHGERKRTEPVAPGEHERLGVAHRRDTRHEDAFFVHAESAEEVAGRRDHRRDAGGGGANLRAPR